MFRHSSRKLPLNDSINGLSVGFPGLEKSRMNRVISIAIKHYPDTRRALLAAEADRDQARLALQRLLDTIGAVNNAHDSLQQVIEDLRDVAGEE